MKRPRRKGSLDSWDKTQLMKNYRHKLVRSRGQLIRGSSARLTDEEPGQHATEEPER